VSKDGARYQPVAWWFTKRRLGRELRKLLPGDRRVAASIACPCQEIRGRARANNRHQNTRVISPWTFSQVPSSVASPDSRLDEIAAITLVVVKRLAAMRVTMAAAVIDRLFADLPKHEPSPLFRPRRLATAAALDRASTIQRRHAATASRLRSVGHLPLPCRVRFATCFHRRKSPPPVPSFAVSPVLRSRPRCNRHCDHARELSSVRLCKMAVHA
jgi:hypothetical protein